MLGTKRAIVGFSATELREQFVKWLRAEAQDHRTKATMLGRRREKGKAQLAAAISSAMDEAADYWEGVAVLPLEKER